MKTLITLFVHLVFNTYIFMPIGVITSIVLFKFSEVPHGIIAMAITVGWGMFLTITHINIKIIRALDPANQDQVYTRNPNEDDYYNNY